MAAQEKKEFPVLERGEYLATLDPNYTTLKSTVNGKGTYVNARFQIVEGDAKGRGIFHKFHVTNGSAKCLQISAEQAEKFLKAVGQTAGLDAINGDLLNLRDYGNQECIIKVDVELGREKADGSGNYPDRNVIKGWAIR